MAQLLNTTVKTGDETMSRIEKFKFSMKQKAENPFWFLAPVVIGLVSIFTMLIMSEIQRFSL